MTEYEIPAERSTVLRFIDRLACITLIVCIPVGAAMAVCIHLGI
ncbi:MULTISPECIES: hypothetical protein [unclassified Shinella]|nr:MULTISPECIES: hypothetical protein [unclassified Shinella]